MKYIISIPLCFLILVSSIPHSVVSPSDNVRTFVQYFFPQGWAFFTKNPREMKQDIYLVSNNTVKKYSFSNSSYKNLFGISRKSRRIGYEMSLLHNFLSDSNLTQITSLDVKELKNVDTLEIQEAKGLRLLPRQTFFLVTYYNAPWAWSKNSERFDKNMRAVAFKLRKYE